MLGNRIAGQEDHGRMVLVKHVVQRPVIIIVPSPVGAVSATDGRRHGDNRGHVHCDRTAGPAA